MKIICNIIFCLFSLASTYCQSTFEYLYSSPFDDLSVSLSEDGEGNIYFPVIHHEHALIIKLDFEGYFLDSLSIYNQDGTCSLEYLIKLDSDQFVALGNWTTDTIAQLWYVRFNNNFDILDDKKIYSNNWFITDFQCIINHNDNIVLTANYFRPQSEADVCMYEITLEGDFIRNRFFNSMSIFNIATALLENNEDSTYKVISTIPLEPIFGRLNCFINKVDTNFDLIDCDLIHDPNIKTRASAKWINDSTYLIAGKWFLLERDEWDIGIIMVNKSDSVLSTASFGKPDTSDWPGNYKCLDFISSDNIFFTGSTNSYTPHFQNEPSWIMVNILDSDLNLKNQQLFGGDAYYLVNTVLATQDSGCVLACTRYDYLTQDEESDVYILKVNKDGLLVSTPENPIINNNICYIYPNPGNEILNVNSPMNWLKIQLFDLTGRIECSAELVTGTNSIPVSGLPSGIYLYRIIDHNQRRIQSGKWIKL
jgi:hypothetical protein